MKKYKVSPWVIVYLACGFLYSISIGAGTREILDLASDTVESLRIKKLVSANLDGDSKLSICVLGDISSSITSLEKQYTLFLNFKKIDLESRSRKTMFTLYPGHIFIPAQNIQSGCEEYSEGLIPVRTLDSAPTMRTEKEIDSFLGDYIRPIVLGLEHNQNSRGIHEGEVELVFVNETELWRGGDFLFITPENRKVKGNRSWLLLLPFGVLIDVLTFPIQIILVMVYLSNVV